MAAILNPGGWINMLLLVTKMHRNAPNCMLRFQKNPALCDENKYYEQWEWCRSAELDWLAKS